VRRRPYRVILFDEIEKAHPEVWNALLQILEDGRLTDGQGHTVNFRNTVIIMTSNLGTKYTADSGALGFVTPAEKDVTKETRRDIERTLKKEFRPEFINRIDEIIIFHDLTPEHVLQIVGLQIKDIAKRLAEQGLSIVLTDAAHKWLADEGYEPQFGARPLRRILQRHVENPLSIRLLEGTFNSGDTVVVDAQEDEIVFQRQELDEQPAVKKAEEASIEA